MSFEVLDNPVRKPSIAGAISGWFSSVSKQKLIGIVLAFDVCALWALGLFALMSISPNKAFDDYLPALTIFVIPLLTVYILQRIWAYTIPSLGAFPRQVRSMLVALSGAFILVMGVLFIAGGFDVVGHRRWMLFWLVSSVIGMVLFRRATASAVKHAEAKGELARRAVIIGGGKASEDLIERLEKGGERAIRILGIFDDRGGERSPEKVGRHSKIGTFAELERYCRDNDVDLLIIALPQSAEERILHLMKMLWVLPIDVRIAAHQSKLKLSKRAYTYIGDVPFLSVFDRPLSDWNGAVKAIFDRIVAFFALIALSPLMLIVAALVKMESKGPVFFRQPRHGFNNETILVYKFRSMYTDRTDLHATRQVTKDDPRVTRVGRIIRKTSIDELPQLFNVLRGELSLVGPRPHAAGTKAGNRLYQDVVDGYFARHRMKPGITGWAQINGWRGETDTIEKIERRVEHDLHYIENWSLAFDLYILAMTPLSLFNTKNAY
jgi:Undecaprenyl-phosphate glucose phosphotransferase